MPLSFPSHAAAILPLYLLGRGRRWSLHPTALLIGSLAPDLAYPLRWDALATHRPAGVLTFCLPVGLLAVLWAEWLVLPVLCRALPCPGGFQPARLLRTRGLPPRPALREWLLLLLALALGTLTHLLWDGFTHAGMWPARALYPQVQLFGSLPLAHALQLLSSGLGALIFIAFLAWLYPRLPALQALPACGSWRCSALCLGPPAALIAVAMLARVLSSPPGEHLRRTLWYAGWTGVDAGVLGLTLTCMWYRLRHGR